MENDTRDGRIHDINEIVGMRLAVLNLFDKIPIKELNSGKKEAICE
jgi:hypothetical protein